MGAFSDLLSRSIPVATPATLATQTGAWGEVSQGSQVSQEVTAEIRTLLLSLAAAEDIDRGVVDRQNDDDLWSCTGLSEPALVAYLHARCASEHIAAGVVPPDFTVDHHCPQCGPVWLPARLHPKALTCPWCFRRRAGNPIPRPLPGNADD